jgi:hypothetical protein
LSLKAVSLDHHGLLSGRDAAPSRAGGATNLYVHLTSEDLASHSAWTYKRLDDGSYTWTSPTAHQYTAPASRRPPA